WGEPDGADLHRRPLGRLPLRGAASGGAGEPGDERVARRWAPAARSLGDGLRSMRTAGERAAAGRAAPLLAVAVPGAGAARAASGAGARGDRVGVGPEGISDLGHRGAASGAEVRARGRVIAARGAMAGRRVPRESAEHADWPADPGDVRR